MGYNKRMQARTIDGGGGRTACFFSHAAELLKVDPTHVSNLSAIARLDPRMIA